MDEASRHRRWNPLWASLLLALAVFGLFTWPLLRQPVRVIPVSHTRPAGAPAVRAMVPSDTLQLLYHFWLGADMITGRTPLFYNLYEMNEGDDAARYEPGAYYAPFSWIFGLGAAAGSYALGWNLASFISIWLTAWFTWLLAARHTSRLWGAATAALVAVVFPYRWISLMGGSPTGFAMAWVPLLALGVDEAVRRDRPRGGAWAGLALALAGAGDAHTFFFAALSAPFWMLVAFAAPASAASWDARRLRRAAGAAAFAAAGLLLGYALLRWTARSIGETGVAGGRAWSEVLLFSPAARGFLAREDLGIVSHVALGWFGPIFAAAALAALAWRARRSPRGLWLPALLGLGVLGILVLALGARGPADGLALRWAQRLLPPYRMIRQPAKVFALLPTVAALICAAGWPALFPHHIRRLILVVPLLLLADYAAFMRPALTSLPRTQGAYAAVAAEARAAGRAPRALALPLWPGDSHYASVYQVYAMRHRIRLMNVYRPMVPARYVREVFERFESLNQGVLTTGQADALRARGITHLLFHEDLFPEKVSPFPAGVTLQALHVHPRLAPAGRDGPVWAFRILDEGSEPPPSPVHGAFPAWRWIAARERLEGGAESVDDAGAPIVRFAADGAALRWRRPLRLAAFPDLSLWVRARGAGRLRLLTDPALPPSETAVNGADWTWCALPFAVPGVHAQVQPVLALAQGAVDVDQMMLSAGLPPAIAPGESIVWLAAAFFRVGVTSDDGRSVTLRSAWESAHPVFYGPNLPLPPGTYEVAWSLRAKGPPGGEVARYRIRCGPDETLGWTPLIAGDSGVAVFTHPRNLPLTMELNFLRTTDIQVDSIRVTRLR